MANRYAGICYRCGEIVEPNEGVFEKTSRVQGRKWADDIKRTGVKLPKWLTQHHTCAREYGGTTTHYIYNPKPT